MAANAATARPLAGARRAAGGAPAGAAFPPVRHDLRLRRRDRSDPDFARWFFAEALARELLLRPIGRTVYLMPPYVVSDAEFGLLVARVADILDRA